MLWFVVRLAVQLKLLKLILQYDRPSKLRSFDLLALLLNLQENNLFLS